MVPPSPPGFHILREMRLLRWVPLLLAVIGIYYLANRAKEVKADKLLAQAPAHLGISQRDWDHWSMIAQQIREGHIPDLTASDWKSLKTLCSSADASVRQANVKLLGALKDTPYHDQAVALSEKLAKDSNEWVRKAAMENLEQLGGSAKTP
jgi:HEAT repeat protein